MSYSEKNLLKLLDYEHLDIQMFLEKMSKVLNLQYFKDETTKIYTLAGTSFVIDFFEKKFKLIFVDESWYCKFRYVEYFLNYYFNSKDLIPFYNFIRYFSQFDKTHEPNGTSQNLNNLVCQCIHNYQYCINSNFTDTLSRSNDGEAVYNIFSHKEEYHFYNPFFISINKDLAHRFLKQYNERNNLNLKMNEITTDFETFKCLFPSEFDVSLMYDISSFTISIYKYFLVFSPECYFTAEFKGCKIEIKKDCRVLIDEIYKKKETFLFKKGLKLPVVFEILINE